MVRSSKKLFWGSLCSERNAFSHAAGAKGDFFSWINFFCRDGSNEVLLAPGRGREVGFHPTGSRDPGRDPDREMPDYDIRYIDKFCQRNSQLFKTKPRRSFLFAPSLEKKSSVPVQCQPPAQRSVSPILTSEFGVIQNSPWKRSR